MKKIGLGIIGAGRIGKLHAENLRLFQDVEVKSISDLYTDPIAAWAQDIGITQVSENYQDILEDDGIQAVLVCAPTNIHPEIIYDAISAGKHIFCEKPVSFDLNESQKISRLVENTNIKFQVGFNRRFDRNFVRVHETTDMGEIGRVHIVKITSRDPEPPTSEYIKSSGGLFIDMSIHDFDMARFLSGSDVTEVYVAGGNLVNPIFEDYGDIDTAVITLKFSNGAIGVIDNSREAAYGYDQRIEVFGSKGSLQAENECLTTVKRSLKNGTYIDNPKYFFLERYKEAYVSEMRSFIDAIKYDTETLCTINDGLQAERIAHAAKRSLELGKPMKLEHLKVK